MRKKELLALNQRLTETVTQQEKLLAELHDQLESLQDDNRCLREALDAAEKPAQQCCLTDTAPVAENASVVKCPAEEENDGSAAPLASPKESDFAFLQHDVSAEQNSVTPREYAVQMIARIVLESARVGCLLGKAPVQIKQDLLQLALGRTEVAKAEIFRIVNTAGEPAEQIASISAETKQACDYLSGLLLQIPS